MTSKFDSSRRLNKRQFMNAIVNGMTLIPTLTFDRMISNKIPVAS